MTSPIVSSSDGLATRWVGDIRATVISGGTMTMPARLLVPEDQVETVFGDLPPDGRFACGMNSLLAQSPLGVVLVDPIEHADDDPTRPPGHRRGVDLDTALTRLDTAPGAVDHVVITHRHADHMSGALSADGTLRFPNARHWLHRADWESRGTLAQGDGSHVMEALHAAGALELVDVDTDLIAGITMIHTPGETPGHCAVRMASGSSVAYYLGDIVHHSSEVEHLSWGPPSADMPRLLDTRRQILSQMVAEDAVGAYTHANHPAWGRPRRHFDSFRWDPGM